MHPWWPEARFEAVEIFYPYIERFQLEKRYDWVWQGDVRVAARYFAREFDLVIFGDVLEHMRRMMPNAS